MSSPAFADGFADRLRKARERAGLTQRELGGEAGVNYSQISRYEQGTAFPRPGVLLRLAAAVGVPVGHLRDGEEIMSLPVSDAEILRVTFTADTYLKLKAEADAEGLTVDQIVVLLAKEHIARLIEAEEQEPFSSKNADTRLRRIAGTRNADPATPKPKR